MPRPVTNPPITYFTQNIKVADLRRWGYLKPGRFAFVITLYNPYTKAQSGQVSAELSMLEAGGWLRLRYSIDQNLFDYTIQLEAVLSNLGKGIYYLFRCPISDRRAKTLYFRQGMPYFAHRIVTGVKYHTQYDRGPFKGFLALYRRCLQVEQACSRPWRKKWYAGKPTRWFLATHCALGKNEEQGGRILSSR